MFIRFIVKTSKEKEIFLNELYRLKDFETLYKIGEVNSCGNKEKRRVPSFLYSDWLERKYNETENEVYNDILFLLLDRNEKFFQYWLAIGISLIATFVIW
jgi:hypothetical protein